MRKSTFAKSEDPNPKVENLGISNLTQEALSFRNLVLSLSCFHARSVEGKESIVNYSHSYVVTLNEYLHNSEIKDKCP